MGQVVLAVAVEKAALRAACTATEAMSLWFWGTSALYEPAMVSVQWTHR
jgi:hypothetical protein